jgi:hypothetical protein
MTDRELLEAAAKAAGLLIDGWHRYGGLAVWRPGQAEKFWSNWNPLTDDGDALRLAVKLEILVLTARGFAVANSTNLEAGCVARIAINDATDQYAATRRAIVLAAAALAGAAQEATT